MVINKTNGGFMKMEKILNLEKNIIIDKNTRKNIRIEVKGAIRTYEHGFSTTITIPKKIKFVYDELLKTAKWKKIFGTKIIFYLFDQENIKQNMKPYVQLQLPNEDFFEFTFELVTPSNEEMTEAIIRLILTDSQKLNKSGRHKDLQIEFKAIKVNENETTVTMETLFNLKPLLKKSLLENLQDTTVSLLNKFIDNKSDINNLIFQDEESILRRFYRSLCNPSSVDISDVIKGSLQYKMSSTLSKDYDTAMALNCTILAPQKIVYDIISNLELYPAIHKRFIPSENREKDTTHLFDYDWSFTKVRMGLDSKHSTQQKIAFKSQAKGFTFDLAISFGMSFEAKPDPKNSDQTICVWDFGTSTSSKTFHDRFIDAGNTSLRHINDIAFEIYEAVKAIQKGRELKTFDQAYEVYKKSLEQEQKSDKAEMTQSNSTVNSTPNSRKQTEVEMKSESISTPSI